MKAPTIIILLAAYITTPCALADEKQVTLDAAYDSSLQNDPAYQAARFDYQASQQEKSIGMAGLLPQVSAGSRYGETKQISGQDTNSKAGDDSYHNGEMRLSARQVLFDKAKMASFEQSEARERAGTARYDYSTQDLFNRVTDAYFEVARQDNELKLAMQQKVAIEGLVKQTKRMLEAGDGTITDTEEAQARLDLIKAQEIEYSAKMQAALRKLSGRTGLSVESIVPMLDTLPNAPLLDTTQNLQFWQTKARFSAPTLEFRKASIDIAESQLNIQKAGNYPTLSLVSEISKSQQDNLPNDYRLQSSSYIGLSLDVPIFAGGGVVSAVKKSEFELSSASAQYDDSYQQVIEEIERNYLGVVSGYEKCKALQTAVRSNQRALDSVQKGYQAGERSTIDILNAQQVLYAARRDLLNTKLLMLQSYVSLHALTGQMQRNLLLKVQELF